MSSEHETARTDTRQREAPEQAPAHAEPFPSTDEPPLPEPAQEPAQEPKEPGAQPDSPEAQAPEQGAVLGDAPADEGTAPAHPDFQDPCAGAEYTYGAYYPDYPVDFPLQAPEPHQHGQWDYLSSTAPCPSYGRRPGAIGGWGSEDAPPEPSGFAGFAPDEDRDCVPETVTVHTYNFNQIPKSVWEVLRGAARGELCEYCEALENLEYDEEMDVITSAFCESCRIKISKRPENRCPHGYPGCLGQRWVGPLGDVSLRCRACDQHQRAQRRGEARRQRQRQRKVSARA